MKILKKITNGLLLIVIGIMHTHFALSAEAFGKQFQAFSRIHYFRICGGLDELPVAAGHTNLDAFSAFWFFYFGILIIPLGLLVHSIERSNRTLPHSFTISYLMVVVVGCYMIPNSGMTFLMLPHAIYMLVSNYVKGRKIQRIGL